MKGAVACEVFDLMPAGGAVGDDEGIRVGGQLSILDVRGPGSPAVVDRFSAATLAFQDSFLAFDAAFLGGAFFAGG